MTPKAEAIVSEGLREVLALLPVGASIERSEPFRTFQEALERFLPAELGWEQLKTFGEPARPIAPRACGPRRIHRALLLP